MLIRVQNYRIIQTQRRGSIEAEFFLITTFFCDFFLLENFKKNSFETHSSSYTCRTKNNREELKSTKAPLMRKAMKIY